MSEYDRNLRQVPQSEDELEQQLVQYGPLMVQQEQFESEIDPIFATRLRARLMDTEELAPHPTFARNLRARLLRRPGARPLQKPERVSWPRRIGPSVLATAALVIFLLVRVHHDSRPQTSSFSAPYPQRADLFFSFPSLPTTIHRLTATLSLVHPASGIPYAGHLRLTAPNLPNEPSSFPAYRLAIRTGVVARGRGLFRIASPVRQEIADGVTWLVAQDGGGKHRPLHSLAVSTRTGELIYHDRRNHLLPLARHPLDGTRAVAIARSWLTRLGWPSARMPLRFFGPVSSMKKVRAVVLGWPNVGPTATDAATLWVAPDGSVIEAWVWPPISRHGTISAGSITAAWHQVQTGKIPLAVEGISPRMKHDGVGTLRLTRVVSLLTSPKAGRLYLVPAYRFTGTARIAGASSHPWFSLVPGGTR